IKYAAARLSAESPAWKAATRSGDASFLGAVFCAVFLGTVRSIFAMAALEVFRTAFGQFQRTGVDLAARPARQQDRMRDRILDAVIGELGAQDLVERVRRQHLCVCGGRADDQHEFAACLEPSRLAGEFGEG